MMPPGFDLPAGLSLPCDPIYGFERTSASCSVNENGNIEFKEAFPTVDFLIIFSVEITNPSYASTFFLRVNTFDAAPDVNGQQQLGPILEQSGQSTFKITTTPGILNARISNGGQESSDVVGEYTDVQISFEARNPVAVDGYFVFSMAKWNSGTQTVGLETSQIRYDPNNFSNLHQGYKINCSAEDSSGVVHDNIACIFKVAAVSTVEQIASSRDELKVTNLANKIDSGTILTVQITDTHFRNPPSTTAIETYEASSHSRDGSFIDGQSVGIRYKIDTAAIIDSSKVTIRSATGEINEEQQFDFTIYMPLPLPVGAIVKITVPTSVSIYSDDARTQLILNAATGYSPIYQVPQVQVTDTTNQVIEVNYLVPSSKYYVDANNYVRFSLTNLKNPGSVQATDPFSMSIYEQDNIILNVDNNGLTYSAQPGFLSNVEVFPDNYKTRQQVPYQFSFETKNALSRDGHIGIIVPPEISVDPSALVLTPQSTISFSSSVRLEWEEDTRELSINNAFEQEFQPPVQIKFIIDDGLTNSFSTDPITPFIIQTHDSNKEVIDEGFSEAIEYSANEINQIQVTACADKQAASVTGEVCTYRLKFLIGADYPIVSGSVIEIELPDDLELDDPQATIQDSYTDGIADLSSYFAVEQGNKVIRVNGAFVKASAPNGEFWKQDSFSINIAGIKSPRSTAPTLSFKARIKTSTGYVQYQKLQGVYANVQGAKMFNKVIIQRSNEENGADSGIYNFTIQLASKVYKNEYIKITPPPSIVINPGGDQCRGVRLLASTLSCVLQDTSLYLLVVPDQNQEELQPGDILQFQVQRITNPVSMEPTDSFEIFITQSLYQNYYVNQMVTGLSILNTEAGRMRNVQVLPDTNSLGKVTDYSLYFTIENDLTLDGYVEVEFPAEYFTDLEQISCTAIKVASADTFCQVSATKPNIIEVLNAFEGRIIEKDTEIAIKLLNVRNPVSSVSQQVIANEFFIRTMSPQRYPIDSTYDLDFTLGCQFPCLTCDLEATRCTSCQMDLNLFEQSCFVECPAGNYQDENNVCQACAHTCERCDNSPDQCTSCYSTGASPWLVPETGQCQSACPVGTYSDISTRKCELCVGNCETCHSQNVCDTCKAGFYYYASSAQTALYPLGFAQCLDECPTTSIAYDSADTLACQECTSPCYTCEGTTETCTSCQEGFYLYNTECVSECPDGYKLDESNNCYRANEFIMPFITLVVPLFFLILIAISNYKTKETKPVTAFLALESSFLVIFWIYQLIFMLKDGHTASGSVIALALVANYILNCVFYEFYKIRIDKGHDKLYADYKQGFPATQKTIIVWMMLTSFNLFRFQYCCFFGNMKYKARLSQRMKYYKRMNRYTLFWISFVFVPIICAALYNLFYTWSGRQVFWIDIECILVCLAMVVAHVIIMLRTESEYILNLDSGDKMAGLSSDKKAARRNLYIEDPLAQELADDINDKGFKENATRVQNLTTKQREGTLTALYQSIFKRKQHKVDIEAYKLKHGRGEDFNHDVLGLDNVELEEIQVEKNKGFATEKMSNAKRMLYSSAQEIGQKVSGSKIKQGGEYEQFNDVSNTMNDLGQTQVLDDITPGTTPRPLLPGEDESARQNYQLIGNNTTTQDLMMTGPINADDLAIDQNLAQANGEQPTLRMRNERHRKVDSSGIPRYGSQTEIKFDGIVEESQNVENQASEAENRELFNFASAPQNSKSALKGNLALKKRYEQLQAELKKKGIRQASLLADGDLDAIEREAINVNFGAGPPVSIIDEKVGEDSDDILEQFTSSQWGEGTSKVIANHYLTMQNNKMEHARRTTTEWKKLAAQNPNQNQNFKLTADDFRQISEELKESRIQKKQSKQAGAFIGLQRQELEVLVSAEQDEVEDLKRYMRELQEKIDVEMKRLQETEDLRRQDLDFVENAFYTSNEEGMGVSPNTFEHHNRMPRPGTRSRSPDRPLPFGDPIDSVRNSIVQGSIVQGSIVQNSIVQGSSVVQMSPSHKSKMSPSQKSKMSPSHKSKMSPSHKSSEKMGAAQSSSVLNSQTQMNTYKQSRVGSVYPDGIEPYMPTEPRQEPKLLMSNMQTETFGQTEDQLASANIKDGSRKGVSEAGTEQAKSKSIPVDPSESAKSIKPMEGYEYYTSQDEDGNPIQKLRKRGDLRKKKRSKSPKRKKSKSPKGRTGRTKSPKNRSNNLSKYLNGSGTNIQNQADSARGRSQNNSHALPPRGPNARNASGQVSPVPIAAQFGRQAVGNSPQFQAAALQQLDNTQISKSKKRTHKKQAQAIKEYGGAYFMHTNFERAVIATNGRAPYNNKEVEVITKPEGFDPNEYKFQNNWVNHLMNSGAKKKDRHRTNVTSQNQLNESSFLNQLSNQGPTFHNQDFDDQQTNQHQASESITATTVFQGKEPLRLDSVTGSEVRPFEMGTNQTLGPTNVGDASQGPSGPRMDQLADAIEVNGQTLQQHNAPQTVNTFETDGNAAAFNQDLNARKQDSVVVEDFGQLSQPSQPRLETSGSKPGQQDDKIYQQSPFKQQSGIQQPISPLGGTDGNSGKEQMEFHVQQFGEDTEQQEDTIGQQN